MALPLALAGLVSGAGSAEGVSSITDIAKGLPGLTDSGAITGGGDGNVKIYQQPATTSSGSSTLVTGGIVLGAVVVGFMLYKIGVK